MTLGQKLKMLLKDNGMTQCTLTALSLKIRNILLKAVI